LATKLDGENVCTECGGTRFHRDYVTGELICWSCGYVISSNAINQGPEWRAFDPEERDKLPRAGSPYNWFMHDKGLSTEISWQNRDLAGRSLKPDERARLNRLRKWHKRSKVYSSNQRNLSQALSEISKIGYVFSLPRNVVDTSSIIYRMAVERKLLRGRRITNVAVASVYMACRQCGVIRNLEDVAKAAEITRKEVAVSYRHILREPNTSVPLADPKGYISKLIIRLGLTGETKRLTKVILDQASMIKLTNGRAPSGIAAACVYITILRVRE
jgi:transcription initiation factor TFIIB